MTFSRRTSLTLFCALLLALGTGFAGLAQPAPIPDAAEIELGLRRLNVLGGALYVAAHPDDENTAFLAWLQNGRLVRTAYLAMTRGDGGQNLIGDEKGDLLGLLRTQELLAARRIDGATQLFTRAIDFGYSKSPEEALAIWGHDAVLSDVVRAIRRFRPDVIVTRFPPTGEGGHGHHTASAILAEEAFVAAADPSRFPEQLDTLQPWQAKRLLWNVFRFRAETPRNPQPGQISVDLGAYNALLGRSYTEIAAQSRSMHKSQGFGSAERRGSFLNDLQPRLGEPARDDLFDGVDLTWNRVPGSAEVAALVERANREFRPEDPSAIVPILVRAYAAMGTLGDDPLVSAKREETLELIRACAGLWLEAIAPDFSASPGSAVEVTAVALNRSSVPFELESVEAGFGAPSAVGARLLENNVPVETKLALTLPADLSYTNPYWLARPHAPGLYTVDDPKLIGRPESPPALSVKFTIRSGDQRLVFETAVLDRWTDPVKGEQYRGFEIAPPVTLALDERVVLFGGNGDRSSPAPARAVRVRLEADRAGVSGDVRLRAGKGWTVSPASQPFALTNKADRTDLVFEVGPPARADVSTLSAVAVVDGREIDRSVARIEYPHLPIQTLFPPAEAKLVRVSVARQRRLIGYVMGSGDEIPGVLRQIGYEVTLLSDAELENGDLSRYDTLVAGVRAFNTRDVLARIHGRLMKFVEDGGTFVVQYTTTSGLVTKEIGPYPFTLSHDRVTDETAEVTLLDPASSLLTTPNRITAADFDGWVQERGLYFASEREGERWDDRYATVLASHDAGESGKAGGLLYTRYGKGVFVYTGWSFFRQLPAGVPGAVRLFVNLVSAGGSD